MSFDEFVSKTDAIREQFKKTTDVEIRRKLRAEFFDLAIDYYENFGEAIDHYTKWLDEDFGEIGTRDAFVGAVDARSRTKNTAYNETPTKGTIMSAKTSVPAENSIAPKTSKFAEKLNSLKPSNLADEKKETVLRRIKITAAFAAGVLTTVTAVAVKSYYDSINATDEAQESDESSETESTD